jgi:hypothetical protein
MYSTQIFHRANRSEDKKYQREQDKAEGQGTALAETPAESAPGDAEPGPERFLGVEHPQPEGAAPEEDVREHSTNAGGGHRNADQSGKFVKCRAHILCQTAGSLNLKLDFRIRK